MFVCGMRQNIQLSTGYFITQLSGANINNSKVCLHLFRIIKGKAVSLHAMKALGGRGCIAPTHSRPRH
jgi:hypothetical protein